MWDIVETFKVPDGKMTEPYPLWYDIAGNVTDDLEKKVEERPFFEPVFKEPKTPDEFEIVFQNELKKSGTQSERMFIEDQITIFSQKKNEIILLAIDGFKPDISLINNYLKFLGDRQDSVTKVKSGKDFSDLLEHEDPIKFSNSIKEKFPAVIGSGLNAGALYIALQETKKIKVGTTPMEVYNAMTNLFGSVGIGQGFRNQSNKQKLTKKTEDLIKQYVDALKGL